MNTEVNMENSQAQSALAEFDGWPHASWKRIASLKWEGLRLDTSNVWSPRQGELPLNVWWDSSPRRIAKSVSTLLVEGGLQSGRRVTLAARRAYFRRQLPPVSVQIEIIDSKTFRVVLLNISSDPTGELSRNDEGRRFLSFLRNMDFEPDSGLDGQHSASLTFASPRELERKLKRTFSLVAKSLLPTGPIYVLDTQI